MAADEAEAVDGALGATFDEGAEANSDVDGT